MSLRKVLVVDDEANMRRVLEIMLSRRGYRTAAAVDGRDALDRLAKDPADLVISDLRMPDINGIELLRQLRQAGNDVPLIMITAHGTIESAVEAMRLGACDYLLRPFDVEALDLAIQRVFAQREILQQNRYLKDEVERHWPGLVGDGPSMQRLKKQIAQVGPTRASVLLSGETGTGKELVARAVHQASDRRERLFVPINCAAIPGEMLESELFGHEKGAFTGALRQRIGKFELADGGTLFLDEITEMPVVLQAKLLRALQEGEIQRLGSNETLRVDVRVVAATNRAPREAVSDGRLREDLYFRLNVFALALPPLRERKEDLESLVQHFIANHQGFARTSTVLSPAMLAQLLEYSWPGNVRELGNVVERALILAGGQPLAPEHLLLEGGLPSAHLTQEIDRPGAQTATSDLRLEPAVEALESRLISDALRRTGGNKSRAAQLLQVSERSVWYKLKKYGLGADEPPVGWVATPRHQHPRLATSLRLRCRVSGVQSPCPSRV